jgi:urease accessory protein
MGYATPATALEGMLSGLAHPVIGIDHLLFIIGAGVLAARVERGLLLPLVFVVASVLSVCLRVAGPGIPLGEVWVAVSLVVLGAVMLASRGPGKSVVAALFLVGGAIHGYALAEGMIGAEKTPLYAYLAGLTVIQCLIAFAAWAVAGWFRRIRPALPLDRLAGIALGLAGVLFTIQSALS